jgi:hypothetical protein
MAGTAAALARLAARAVGSIARAAQVTPSAFARGVVRVPVMPEPCA